MKRAELANGVYFSAIIDPRFKTNRLSVNLFTKLDKKNVSDNAIVPFLLRRGSETYPDFSALNKRLSELYGASLDADVRKVGDNQIITLAISGIDSQYALGSEDMVKEMTGILSDLLFRPKLINGLFREEDLELEKKNLFDLIEGEVNEKRSFAISRLTEIMCDGEPYGIFRYGRAEDVEKITAKSAADAYHNLLKTAQVEIMFTGCGNPDTACAAFKEDFTEISRDDPQPIVSEISEADGIKEETEFFPVSQSKMVLGFKSGVGGNQGDTAAMRVMTALYGGTPFSKLFVNVREKQSLCYYCVSRYDRPKGIVMVDCGIEKGNIEKAKKEILNQLEMIRQGDFDEKAKRETILSIVNGFNTVSDSCSALENWYLVQIACGTDRSPVEEAEAIRAVSKERIVMAAKSLSLGAVYVLTANEDAGKEQ